MRLRGSRSNPGRRRVKTLALRKVFVDTSAWYALADDRDPHHGDAEQLLALLAEEGRNLVTTNHVVGEAYTLLRVRLGAGPALEFLRRSRSSARLETIFVPQSWETAAVELLLQYEDQDFSFVDATSFVAMTRLGLLEAFAFDQHFHTAGFIPPRTTG